MSDWARSRKLAKRIQQIVASAIGTEVKDPRLAPVTVTDARITADLRDATVYYTVMPESLDAEPDFAGAAAALESAAGVLRSMVGARTGVRFTPTLTFEADRVPDAVQRIDDALTRAREADDEVARLAAGAAPAGDPDPYKPAREQHEE
jgi:ribosome-binding factor A